VGVVGAGQVAGLGRAQEAEAVGQDFQHAVGGDAFGGTGQHLEQGEDHVLLARARHGLGNTELLSDVQQLLRRHPLQVAQRILREAFGDVRHRPVLRRLVAVVVARQAVVAMAVAVAAVAEAVAAAAVAATAFAAFAALAAGVAAIAVVAAVAGLLRAAVVGRRRGLAGGRRVGARRLRGLGAGGVGGAGVGGVGAAGAWLAHALFGGFAGFAHGGGVSIVGQVRFLARMRAPGTGGRGSGAGEGVRR